MRCGHIIDEPLVERQHFAPPKRLRCRHHVVGPADRPSAPGKQLAKAAGGDLVGDERPAHQRSALASNRGLHDGRRRIDPERWPATARQRADVGQKILPAWKAGTAVRRRVVDQRLAGKPLRHARSISRHDLRARDRGHLLIHQLGRAHAFPSAKPAAHANVGIRKRRRLRQPRRSTSSQGSRTTSYTPPACRLSAHWPTSRGWARRWSCWRRCWREHIGNGQGIGFRAVAPLARSRHRCRGQCGRESTCELQRDMRCAAGILKYFVNVGVPVTAIEIETFNGTI
jgi:hypothetical protein